MNEFKIISLLYVDIPRKTKKDKRVRLNLNVYRNQHQNAEHEVKRCYQDIIAQQFPQGIKYDEIEIDFTMYKHLKKNGEMKKSVIDKSNVYSIVIKYLLDALVENNIIEDDNDYIVKREVINPTKFIKVEEGEERAEIIIRSIKK